jgi:hypothetical protein
MRHSFSVTYKGAKHESDAPCQDCSDHIDKGTTSVIVVADGHGSSRCFRSDIGSAKAVESAKICIVNYIEEKSEFFDRLLSVPNGISEFEISEFKIQLYGVVKKIIDKWFVSVMKDEEANPISDDPRLSLIEDKYKDRYLNDVDYRCHAYGTTLLVAVKGANFSFGFHVGDGKCVVLYDDGTWRLPIPWDDKCSFNTTTSICDDDSLSGFRYWIQINKSEDNSVEYGFGIEGQNNDYEATFDSSPVSIFIGSDGVEDSYPRIDNDKYLIDFYRNRIICLCENGIEAFDDEIKSLAYRFAERGSTDDVSIAVITNEDVCNSNVILQMKRDSELHELTELAVSKRRDADEKKSALISFEKIAQSKISAYHIMNEKLKTTEQDINELIEENIVLNKSVQESKDIFARNTKKISDLDSILNDLNNEFSDLNSLEFKLSSRLSQESNETKRIDSQLILCRKERNLATKKIKNAIKNHNDYLTSMVNNGIKMSTSDSIINTLLAYKNAFVKSLSIGDNLSMSSINPIINIDSSAIDCNIKKKIDNLANTVKKTESNLRQIDTKINNLKLRKSELQGSLNDTQTELKRISEEKEKIKKNIKENTAQYDSLVIHNKKLKLEVKQRESEIIDNENKIEYLKTEYEKNNNEINSIREQAQKQEEKLNEIKTNWEKVNTEALLLEESLNDREKDKA